ncbi:MAG: penicillin-binding transpeptidase domain-containing protein [Eubacteriales bacterium]|nr:penicillin-binding transpeptidase domain-containing protein [Eubacteriales bacterium]
MKGTFVKRYIALGIVFSAIFLALVGRLFYMQYRQGDVYAQQAAEKKTRELRLVGERGRILDSSGMPLAYNSVSYNVQFVRDSTKRSDADTKSYTAIISRTIDIVEKHGGSTLADYNIRRQEDGSFAFYFGDDLSAETLEKKETSWRKSMGYTVKKYPTAEDVYLKMRETYQIPEEMEYEKALKVLSVWQNVQMSAYRSYLPITVAENVDLSTVAEVEIYGNELTGMQIDQSTTRVYTKKSIAAHIVGYMGKMTDEESMIENEGMGYLRTDLVGIAGIESSMEYELTPNISERTGSRVVELDSRGNIKSELEYRAAKDGNTVQLTIDTGLQIHLEEALEDNIVQIRAEQERLFDADRAKEASKQKYAGMELEDLRLASQGAAVVMNVRTGEVLAMASYPSFDPNIFTGGLSLEEYEALRDDARNPLFNKAIASTATPGSIFKMVTGIAGLAEGVVGMDEKIDDEGLYDKHVVTGHAPRCWRYPYFSLHKDQDIVKALTNSCNYYFYTVADRLGIERLNKWADLLGLTSLTGVELPSEKQGQIGNQSTLYDASKAPSGTSYLIYKSIKDMLVSACQANNLTYGDDKYSDTAIKLMNLVSVEGNIGPDIRAILMNDLKLTLAQITNFTTKDSEGKDVVTRLDTEISSRVTEIKWDDNDTILTGIGQSVTLVSPIAVARYISAVVNGGEVYEATLLKAIITPDGEVEENQPQLIRKLDVDSKVLDAIKQGMSGVVSPEDGGTAADYFKDFKYLDQISGKTGTAQVSTVDLENNAWFVAFAPKEQPEIAVVVFIPNGYAGSKASTTVRAAVEYYLDGKTNVDNQDNIPSSNTLIP